MRLWRKSRGGLGKSGLEGTGARGQCVCVFKARVIKVKCKVNKDHCGLLIPIEMEQSIYFMF